MAPYDVQIPLGIPAGGQLASPESPLRGRASRAKKIGGLICLSHLRLLISLLVHAFGDHGGVVTRRKLFAHCSAGETLQNLPQTRRGRSAHTVCLGPVHLLDVRTCRQCVCMCRQALTSSGDFWKCCSLATQSIENRVRPPSAIPVARDLTARESA